jgi:hypothetical protein
MWNQNGNHIISVSAAGKAIITTGHGGLTPVRWVAMSAGGRNSMGATETVEAAKTASLAVLAAL